MKKYFLLIIIMLLVGCSTLPKRQEYIANHPELSEKLKSNILKAEISIGMTPEQVLASWGEPSTKGSSINQYYTSEHWVYYDTYIVYFQDGKVISIDELAR